MFKPRVENKFLGRFARAPLLLLLAALMFAPLTGCYAHARPAGIYYSEGYYGGYRRPYRGYYPRERYRYYRAPDYYRGGGYHHRHHHHHHGGHHRHHRGPRW